LSEPSAPEPRGRGAAGGTLRDLLDASDPRDFKVKKAWQAVIRGLRQHRRETGEVAHLRAWADVERSLDTVPLTDDVRELKWLLRTLVKEEASIAAVLNVDRLLERMLPAFAEGLVRVDIEGFPPGFEPAAQARLVRQGVAPPLEVEAPLAAALVREFDGFVLGGSCLRARAHVREGEVLPPVPRSLRARPMRRGRQGAWLPYTDEVGRRSLTPRVLAQRQAERLGADRVIDGFCGIGGNAIAFAEAGARVIAVERDPERLDLARRNADAKGVRIDFRLGDLRDVLPTLPSWPLFLDPPWDAIDLGGLLDPARRTMLKLPREFDPAPLGAGWIVHFEFGEGEDDFAVVRMLTLIR